MTTIGVDARAAAEVAAGRGRYVRETLRALSGLGGDEQYVLYARRPVELDLDARFRWELIHAPDALWHIRTARRADVACDAFWSTNSYLTAWFTRSPTAVTVHDLIAFIPGAAAQRRAAVIERVTIAPAVRRAAAFLCMSDATKVDLLARHPRAAGRTMVTPPAAARRFGMPTDDERSIRSRLRLERPFVLGVGTLEPRKNLERLIEAWAGMESEEYELVLVGSIGWDAGAILRRARRRRVRLLGYVNDDELVALYSLCEAFCYPSLYEGFGLPVLEAMAAGAPVITSSVSSLPEVAGDAAVLVDPHDAQAIRAGLERVLSDARERERMRIAGRARAAQFSWDETARLTRDVLLRIARQV